MNLNFGKGEGEGRRGKRRREGDMVVYCCSDYSTCLPGRTMRGIHRDDQFPHNSRFKPVKRVCLGRESKYPIIPRVFPFHKSDTRKPPVHRSSKSPPPTKHQHQLVNHEMNLRYITSHHITSPLHHHHHHQDS